MIGAVLSEMPRGIGPYSPTPSRSPTRHLLYLAQTMVYRDMRTGFEATRILEEALGLVEKVKQ